MTRAQAEPLRGGEHLRQAGGGGVGGSGRSASLDRVGARRHELKLSRSGAVGACGRLWWRGAAAGAQAESM